MHETSEYIASKDYKQTLYGLMQRYPLRSYFLLALGISWLYGLPCFGLFHMPLLPWALPLVLSPTIAAFIMRWITEGKNGVIKLLQSYVRWRVGIQWYLFALLGMAGLYFISFSVLPGALASFHFQASSFLPQYLLMFVITWLLGGPLFEEPGWRGFALPRLEEKFGPLVGSLILGVLWGLWHLPLFLIPNYNGTTPGLMGTIVPFAEFLVGTSTISIVLAWLFNNTRGSVLLTMLTHTSLNMQQLLLTIFPLLTGAAMTTSLMLSQYTCFLGFSLLLVLVTRGRLGYDRYLKEIAQ